MKDCSKTISLFSVIFIMLLLAWDEPMKAGGITTDAGLTPAIGKIIIRSQVRYASLGNGTMKRIMIPLMAAYGVRPKLMVMARLPYMIRSMEMMPGMKDDHSGSGHAFIMAKYRAARKNTRQYTVGIAPVLGLGFPINNNAFSSGVVNLKSGLYASFRPGRWSLDGSIAYDWTGVAGRDDSGGNPGDETSLDLSISRQIPVGKNGTMAWAPVLEANVSYVGSYVEKNSSAGAPQRLTLLSAGSTFAFPRVIFEGLYRFPVYENRPGNPDFGMEILGGLRLFF